MKMFRVFPITYLFILFLTFSLSTQAPDTLWTRRYGGADEDIGFSVQQTSDGGYIIVGYTYSFGPGGCDVWLIKTDANGDTLWTKTYGGTGSECGNSVCQTSDGGYIISGMSNNANVYLIKTNIIGDTLWTKTYGGDWGECGYSIQETFDGGYIIAGFTQSFGPGGGGTSAVWLLKTDLYGDTIWSKVYGRTDWDVGWSVQQTYDGGYIIVGETESFGAGREDVYLIKADANGDTIWTRTYGGSEVDFEYSVQETVNEEYIIVGLTASFVEGCDVYLIKTDVSGDTIWTKTYGGGSGDYGYEVRKTSDGGYIIVGLTSSFGADDGDVYLIKTEPDVGIKEHKDLRPETTDMRLTCYPNPFTSVTSVELLGARKEQKVTLEIYDISGRVVKSVPLTTNHLTLGTDLLPGIYFLKADGKNVVKVVKVR